MNRVILQNMRLLERIFLLAIHQRDGMLLTKVILEARARHRADDLLCQDAAIAVILLVVHYDHHLISRLRYVVLFYF